MFISKDTFNNLDLNFVLDNINVHTPYGKSAKKDIKAFNLEQKEELIEELNRVEKIMDLIGKQREAFLEIRQHFKQIKDLRLTFRSVEEDKVLSVSELFEIKIFVNLLKDLALSLTKLKWDIPKDIKILPIVYLERLFDPQGSGTNTFFIYNEFSSKLTETRKQMKDIEDKINSHKKQLREQVENELKIKLRPNGEVTISKDNDDMITRIKELDSLVYSSETYMNLTFKLKTTGEVDELISELEEIRRLEEEEEYKVKETLTRKIKTYLDQLQHNINAIGGLDLLIAKGYHAIGYNCTKPQIIDENTIYIKNGRHIKVEQSLKKGKREFTPISMNLKSGVACITGANMGGKTVALKLIGMLSAMAQHGIFVPAEVMKFSLRENIFMSVGDMQSADMGLSTFGGEIIKIKEAIKDSNSQGLILIDELARGTNPREGFAISKALINFLREKNTITVITTHFDGLANDKDVLHLQVRGLSHDVYDEISKELRENKNHGVETLHQYMDYRLQEVSNETEVPKDAINISRLMGLDEEILEDAEKILQATSH